jgi:hypothetical protein
MPVAPIMVEDRVLVPAMMFDRYLGVLTRWDDEDDRVMLRGRTAGATTRWRPTRPQR